MEVSLLQNVAFFSVMGDFERGLLRLYFLLRIIFYWELNFFLKLRTKEIMLLVKMI